MVLQFAEWRRPLAKEFCKAQALLHPAGALWVCWPKKAAKRPTDLTEAVVRAVGLDHGLVDVKVCAVDDGVVGLEVRLSPEGPPETQIGATRSGSPLHW